MMSQALLCEVNYSWPLATRAPFYSWMQKYTAFCSFSDELMGMLVLMSMQMQLEYWWLIWLMIGVQLDVGKLQPYNHWLNQWVFEVMHHLYYVTIQSISDCLQMQ